MNLGIHGLVICVVFPQLCSVIKYSGFKNNYFVYFDGEGIVAMM